MDKIKTAKDKKEPIYVTFYLHLDAGRSPEGFNKTIETVTNIYEKYGIKAQYGFNGPILQRLIEGKPDTVAKIKRLKMCISWHGFDHSLTPPVDPWVAETHWYNIEENRMDMGRPGGYLLAEATFGVIPLSSDAAGREYPEEIYHFLGAGSYPVKSSYPVDALLIANYPPMTESHLYPYLQPAVNPPVYIGEFVTGISAEAAKPRPPDPVEWFTLLAENMPRNVPGRVKFMNHNDIDPDIYERVIKFLAESPDYKVVWPDPDEQQWAPENSPLSFFKRTYGVNSIEDVMKMSKPDRLPETKKELTRSQLMQAADYILTHWPENGHHNFGKPPYFIDLPEDDLSLSQTFQGFALSLNEFSRKKKLPEKMEVANIHGPIDAPRYYEQGMPVDASYGVDQGVPNSGNYSWCYPGYYIFDAEDVMEAVKAIADNLSEKVPATINIKVLPYEPRDSKEKASVVVNPAEFLYAMAQEYRAIVLKGKPVRAMMVSTTICNSQDGGNRLDRAEIGAIIGAKQDEIMSAFRHPIDPETIDHDWTYRPPRGNQQESWIMSTPFTGLFETTYNYPDMPYRDRDATAFTAPPLGQIVGEWPPVSRQATEKKGSAPIGKARILEGRGAGKAKKPKNTG
jgi:hypothetical protein